MCVETSLTSLVGSFESVIQSCCENQDNSVKPKEEELDQVKQDMSSQLKQTASFHILT